MDIPYNAKVCCRLGGWSIIGRIKAVTEDGRLIVETNENKAYLLGGDVEVEMLEEDKR